jgi:anti-sigma factor RsiW
VNKLLRLFGRAKHEPDIEALSARLDEQLTPASASALDAHIASCVACREALEGLRATRTMLRSMPDMTPPRSFRLRIADVEAAKAPAVSSGGVGALMRWAPALGGVATALFIVVVVADVSTRDGGSGAGDLARNASQREAQTGMIAEDSAATGESTFSQTAESPAAAAGAPDDGAPPVPGPSGTGDDAGSESAPGGATEPTGAPPDGDGAIPDAPAPQPLATPAATAAPSIASGAIAPESDETEQIEAFSEDGADDDGNRTGFLIVEITAAAVAIAAGATFAIWRKRGVAS